MSRLVGIRLVPKVELVAMTDLLGWLRCHSN
nr:MAG TPA: hypothetical protein [Bacteriophage sp.]